MEILLLQPAKPHSEIEAESHWELARPFSLFYLAAALEAWTTFPAQIADLEKKSTVGISADHFFRRNRAMIYGITSTTFTRFEAIELARYIKNVDSDAKVVVGGVHFSHCAEDTLRNIDEIDFVVRGEGELTFVELVKLLEGGKSFEGLGGVSYRNGKQIIHNPDQRNVLNLDEMPQYERFSWEEYPEYLMDYRERIPALSIMSSRGCPYRCVFCSKALTNYRLRKPASVVDEIVSLKKKFGIEAFNFLDLTFTASEHHVRAICRELIDRNVQIRWWCESRANVNPNLLDLMREAGCVCIALGIESGAPRILAGIQKDISLNQVEEFCRKSTKLGINLSAYFMYSLPGETKEDVIETINFATRLQELGANVPGFQPAMIFPGTQLEKIARMKGILKPDFSWSLHYESALNRQLGQLSNIPIFLDCLRPEDLIELHENFRHRSLFNSVVREAVSMPICELVGRGVKSILSRSPSSKLLFSPRFYFKIISNRMTR